LPSVSFFLILPSACASVIALSFLLFTLHMRNGPLKCHYPFLRFLYFALPCASLLKVHSAILKMEAAYFSQMMVPVSQTIWHYFPEDSDLLEILWHVLVSTATWPSL
jgi:hypothetical protein